MTYRSLPLLLSLVCTPTASFRMLPGNLLLSSQSRDERAAKSRDLSTPVGGALKSRASQVLRFSANIASRFSPETPASSDTVSHLQDPETGARVWLVGIVHKAAPYVELVRRTIREVRPHVVMLELDAERIYLLPRGSAKQGQNGLWWWEPEPPLPETRGDSRKASRQRRNKSKMGRSSAVDGTTEVDEIWAAGLEAQACGAQVLLGDRSSKVSKRRENDADLADSEMLRALSRDSAAKRRRLEKAGEGLRVLMALIERRRDSGLEMPESRAIVSKHSELHKLLGPRAFDVVITERDEVMAKNLMTLQGGRTTVAVLGSAHLDGMENILSANGWLKVDQEHSLASSG